MKYLLLIVCLSCSSMDKMPSVKPAKSKRPKTDLIIMTVVLGVVIIWSNDEGFYKHVK